MATVTLLNGKVHRATVTEADVDYVGSLTMDEDLMDAAGMFNNERVEVADITNGERLATYIIPGDRGSGVVGINGAAALKIRPGDLIIVFSYAQMTVEEARRHQPKLVFVDEKNGITSIANSETHGQVA